MKTASAPAKVILLGEHTSLYGNQAIAAAIDVRAYAIVAKKTLSGRGISLSVPWSSKDGSPQRMDRGNRMVKKAVDLVGGGGFDIRINSEIPLASGMGSSSAIASALVTALAAEAGKGWSLQDEARAAWKCENEVHLKSSGLDPFVATFGGVLLYQTGKIIPLKLKEKPELVVAHSGIDKETGDLVRHMEEIKKKEKERFNTFLKESESIVEKGRDAIENAEWEKLGILMNENHALLKDMGFSNEELDRMVEAARKAGAYGAKLSGAGRGGVIVALVGKNSKESVIKALSSMGKKIIDADISETGARIEA